MLTAKPVAIVGNHRKTRLNAPYHDGITEIWAFNSGAMKAPSLDRAFQIHDRWIIAEESEQYNLWLRSCDIPVYMKKKYDDIPSSVAYPYKEVYKLTEHVHLGLEQLKFFTSSFTFAIALAVLENRPKISIYGVELIRTSSEYKKQRECFAFWIGFVAGQGIEMEINCANRIFDKPIYGAEKL